MIHCTIFACVLITLQTCTVIFKIDVSSKMKCWLAAWRNSIILAALPAATSSTENKANVTEKSAQSVPPQPTSVAAVATAPILVHSSTRRWSRYSSGRLLYSFVGGDALCKLLLCLHETGASRTIEAVNLTEHSVRTPLHLAYHLPVSVPCIIYT